MTLSLLWEITLGSWVTAALILLARLIFGRWLTARGKYLLWLPLLLRLLLPYTPPSPTSMLNVIPETAAGELRLTEALPAPEAAEGERAAPVPAGADRGTGEGRPAPLPWIWLTGAGTVLLFQLLLYRIGAKAMGSLPVCTDAETRSTLLRLRQLTGIDGSLRVAWGGAGMLGGLLRPTLVLPVERRKEAAVPILLHELMHQKSRHLWLGLLLRLLTAVYWFNPVVWLCLPLVRQDCEELCDQMVLETGLVAPREYTTVLYSEGLMNGLLSPLPRTNFGGRRGSLRRRIGRIARRRGGRDSRLLPLILCLCILLFGVTAPLAGGAPAPAAESPVPPGYASLDDYLEALQPELGRFGATLPELEAAGVFREAKELRYRQGETSSALSLRREIYGAERELVYTFFLLPFSGERGEQVLCTIEVVPTEEEKFHGFECYLNEEIQKDWRVLPESGEMGRSIAPVTVRTVLGDYLCRRLGEEAKALGLTKEPDEYARQFAELPVAYLSWSRDRRSLVLCGQGLALYENRPGAAGREGEVRFVPPGG